MPATLYGRGIAKVNFAAGAHRRRLSGESIQEIIMCPAPADVGGARTRSPLRPQP